MKKAVTDLDLKKLARETYFNAIRLYKDSCLLFKNNSYPSAYFYALVCIEEIGKLKMIDHFYADMKLNNEVLGHLRETFIDSLFRKNNFYDHRNKHDSALDRSFFSGHKYFGTPKGFKELNNWLSNSEQERQNSLYVDFFDGKSITPQNSVSKNKASKALKAAFLIIEEIEDLGLTGTYWVETEKNKRRSKTILEEIKRISLDSGVSLFK